MNQRRIRVALLGATGSIGRSTLDVIMAHSDRFELVGITANSSSTQLAEIATNFGVRTAILTASNGRQLVDQSRFPKNCEIQFGQDAVEKLAAANDVDIVVSAIVGAAGLRGSLAAVGAGKRLAIANKETMVIAGATVRKLAQKTGAELLPVDSEHSAIYQAIKSGQEKEVCRVILTASGGPFRDFPKEQMDQITPAMALKHPTWKMGPKITVDSATMMNKALEIIEARWLFDLKAGQIEAVIHPQSIIHSLVEFCDGSVIAQLSPPDMKLPIQYALSYPERLDGTSPRLDLTTRMSLELIPPDIEKFPAIPLGLEVAERGGSSGVVVNAANEVAVDAFLNGKLSFSQIVPACRAMLDHHEFISEPTYEEITCLDDWAREETIKWMHLCC